VQVVVEAVQVVSRVEVPQMPQVVPQEVLPTEIRTLTVMQVQTQTMQSTAAAQAAMPPHMMQPLEKKVVVVPQGVLEAVLLMVLLVLHQAVVVVEQQMSMQVMVPLVPQEKLL
jgi:hypothetical protein